jgi:hypothetical protein
MLLLNSAYVVESTLFTFDETNDIVGEITLPEPVIDCVVDDFLFLATNDYLYKIDREGKQIVDQVPLPLRFNYILLLYHDIALVSTDEIIILDRSNLSFKSGIGIEPGDHRPVVRNQKCLGASAEYKIYLVSDASTHSTLRIIDLESGKTIKKLRVERIRQSTFDAQDMTFICLEAGQWLSQYDLSMRRKKRIHLTFEPDTLIAGNDCFSAIAAQGIFFLRKSGEMIDFQPVQSLLDISGTVMLTKDAIVWLDTLTMRVIGMRHNNYGITALFRDSYANHVMGMDGQGRTYLVQNTPGSLLPLTRQRRTLIPALPLAAGADSLWYLQLGAFSEPANALHTYEEFRRKGIPVIVDSTDLYRIRFGGFADKLAALDLVEKMELNGWFVFEKKLRSGSREVFSVGSEDFVIEDGVVRKE